MSIRQGNKVIAGHINYHPDLFDHKWADHLLNDVSWLRADTFSWQDGGVYEAAYDHLESDISGKSLSSETISGITVQFYLADDGHKICPDSQESNVVSIYNATGMAWYYIIDTVNQRFKLPRTKYGFVGLRDSVGKYVPESLPNITSGNASIFSWLNDSQKIYTEGAIQRTVSNSAGLDGGSWVGTGPSKLNASLQSSAYQDDAPVQQRATEQYLYFYVGNFTQTALENTTGLNASLFNNKVDLDGSNATFAHIVEKQDPTAGNNYMWYRKYSDGWVEQGQKKIQIAHNSKGLITLPVVMANTDYIAQAGSNQVNSSGTFGANSTVSANAGTTTQVRLGQFNSASANMDVWWEVKGIAA